MTNNKLILIGALALLAIGGYVVLNAPDKRTTAEKMGDAAEEIGEGFEDAADELGGDDRTLGEKMSDSLSNAKDNLKDDIDSVQEDTADEGDVGGEE
jgi:gas vesicle protein